MRQSKFLSPIVFHCLFVSLGVFAFLDATHPLDLVRLDRSTAAISPLKKITPTRLFKNWGIDSAFSNAHISATDAWKITRGSRNVVVAVIDTGIDAHHKDLADNLWSLPGSNSAPPSKGDSRGIAKIAPVKTYGWDFVRNSANPIDEHGHGTHVAGIIGAISDSKEGVSGVANQVSIMPVRYYSETNPGSVNLANTIKALHYAVDHGAKIINYSGGGPEYSEAEYLAIKNAEAKGVLVVAAAGNERQDTDKEENYYYPAAYRLSNIISVASLDIKGNLLRSSNWGKTRVDVAAPGENIYSTLPGNNFGTMSGTSQATAFVSGLAALMLAKDPTLTPKEIKALIVSNCDHLPSLKDKLVSEGRVNAYRALLAVLSRDGGRFNNPLIDTKPESSPKKIASGPLSILREIMTIPQNSTD